MNSILKKPVVMVLAVMLLVAVTSAVVWSACKRQIDIVRKKAEQQAFERLSATGRFLLNESGVEFHVGRHFFRMVKNSIADSSGSVEEKLKILTEILQKQSELESKAFSWDIFDVSSINQESNEKIDIAMVKKVFSRPRSFPPEVSNYLAAKLAAIISGLELSIDFNWNFRQEIEPRLDERTRSDLSRFLCSSAGSFQYLMVDDSGYYQLFIPVFSSEKHLGSKLFRSEDLKSGLKENRKTLRLIVSITFDQDDFAMLSGNRFVDALQQNLLSENIIFAYKKNTSGEKWRLPNGSEPHKGLLKLLNYDKKGEFCSEGWAKVDVTVPGLGNLKTVLAEKIDRSGLVLSGIDRLVFLLLLLWAALIIFFCGDFILLQKTFSISLKIQLVIIGFAFLLPVFLMGILTGERFFEASNAEFMQQLRKVAENSVIEMDASVKMHQSSLVRNIESAIEKTFPTASGSVWRELSDSEKSEVLHGFLKMIGNTGMIMRNLLVFEKMVKSVPD